MGLLKELYDSLLKVPHTRPTLIIPWIVLSELDGLKKSDSMGFRSRSATAWLLSVLPPKSRDAESALDRPLIRGQRREETLIARENYRDRRDNDALILDCSLYFKDNYSVGSERIILFTDDNNLRLRAQFEGIEIMDDQKLDLDHLLKRIIPISTPTQTEGVAKPPKSRHASQAPPLPRSGSSPATLSRRTPHSPPEDTQMTVSPVRLASSLGRMDIDDHSYPALVPSPFPSLPLHTPSTPHEVYHKLLFRFVHVLAHPLYYQLRKTLEGREIEMALGDWRAWNAIDVLNVMKEWWEKGGIDSMCRNGLERAEERERRREDEERTKLDENNRIVQVRLSVEQDRLDVEKRRTASEAEEEERKRNLKKKATSIWATRPHSFSRKTGSLQQSPLATPESKQSLSKVVSPSKPVKVSIPAPILLASLHRSIPRLILTVTSTFNDIDSIDRWTAPRFDILLEAIHLILRAVSGGKVNDTQTSRIEVSRLMLGFAQEFMDVGVEGIGSGNFV